MTRRLAPYAVAIGGAVVITAAIGAITAFASISGLSAFYLLLVLWLGARWGRGPALAGSVAAFLLFDFFFVPPVGTFTVRGPAELLELVVLLAVALVTSQLAASLRRAQATAEKVASDSHELYQLTTSMLRAGDVTSALDMVARSAMALGGIARFSVVAVTADATALLGGAPLSADDLAQAVWSFRNDRAIGVTLKDGAVIPLKVHGGPPGLAFLPLGGGVVAMEVRADQITAPDLRVLAALVGLAGLLLDRRRAALEAERARGYQASDSMKAAVLSSLSHELKSPIASLRAGLTALTSPRSGLQPPERQLLADLDHQAARLDRMVGDLLALSRLEAGVALDREPHSFADIVGGALATMRSELSGREVVLRVADDLPPVDVDELQAGRLITNLVENATEWAPPDGGIEIGARARGGALEAWVENDGPPIAAGDMERVFDTFWTKRARGTGLGLAICRRVVEAHGGTIRAENRRRGPRFTFTLPLARVPAGTKP
jgi:two-component system, OmpR family, sensor histidine kinase KdpD